MLMQSVKIGSTLRTLWDKVYDKQEDILYDKDLVEYKVQKKKDHSTDKMVSIQYLDLVSVFDTETTSFKQDGLKLACMYCWQFSIDGKTYIGRTWEDFQKMYNLIVDYYDLELNTRHLIVWVHNLAYDFFFANQWLKFVDVFARETKQPFRAITTDGVEFRCSYILAGMSLSKVAENLNYFKGIEKKVGDLDYRLMHGPETPLTEKEIEYCLYDCLVLTAYIWEQINIYEDDITKIPMTNTGRVRYLFKQKLFKEDDEGNSKKGKVRKFMKYLKIGSTNEYITLKNAFTGGFTHSNWLHTAETYNNVYSFDFTSSYPTVMCASDHFPVSEATEFDTYEEELMKYLRGSYCYVFDCIITNLTPKEGRDYESPISFSKCRNVKNYNLNNGRVMNADYLETTATDVDLFEIWRRFYDFDIEIKKTYRYKAGYLPEWFIEIIIELYKNKTTLKDVEEKVVEYLLSKGLINSCYGMTVMDIVSEIIIYLDGTWNAESPNYEETLEKYNKDYYRYLFYPWGVFITAIARANLFTGIAAVGYDFIYADTDSIKFLNYENHKEYFERYNKEITEALENTCKRYKFDLESFKPKTIKGVEKPLGVWDFETEGFYDPYGNKIDAYYRFKTLGAKRYLVEYYDKEGKKHTKITVAGTSKKGTSEFLDSLQNKESQERYLKYLTDKVVDNPYEYEPIIENMKKVFNKEGGFDAFDLFDNGLLVPSYAAHKLVKYYIDNPIEGEFIDYLGNKCKFKEKSAIYMEEGEYHLGLTPEYEALLEMSTTAIY